MPSCRFPQLLDFIDEHPYLLIVDPLLLQLLIQTASLDEYKRLSTKVPLYLMLMAFPEASPRYRNRNVSKLYFVSKVLV